MAIFRWKPTDDLEDGTRVPPREVHVQSVSSVTSKTREASGDSTTTPMATPPNRCSNAMKFFSPFHASLPCVIVIAALCVHNDVWRIFNIIVLCVFCILYVLSSITLVGGAWLTYECTNEELDAHLGSMRESRMELRIHVKCSNTTVKQEWVTSNWASDTGNGMEYREEERLVTFTEHVVTHEETIDFEYGACVDKSPHSVDTGGFNMCGLVFKGVYEWGDPEIALRHKLAVQQAYDDNVHRGKEVVVTPTFKIPPMSPRLIKCGTSSSHGWWELAFFTGLVAFYDCWVGSAAGVADMNIRKVLCTEATVSDNLDTETSSHRVVVAEPMADYTFRRRLRPFELDAASDPLNSRNPHRIENDSKVSFSSASNGRSLEVGQQVIVSFEDFKGLDRPLPWHMDKIEGKIAKVLPGEGTNDTMYYVERNESIYYGESINIENTTSVNAIDGKRVRAFHDSAVVAHVGGRNVLSDVKLACVHCQEMRAMEGFEFCGACGKKQG